MCGIVGYIGSKDALPIIVSGLEKLEYRGYDSAGVAVVADSKLYVKRAVGKLQELKNIVLDDPTFKGASVGIGHTRWATHGRPAEHNAHPHTAGRVSLIHNGIIENYSEIREELTKKGCTFLSETDTEVAAHLLNQFVKEGLDPLEALRRTCKRIRGSYAFLAIDSENPDRILVAKNSTPIIIGIGDGEHVIASDIPAVLSITRDIIILEDGDLAEIRAGSIHVEHNGESVQRARQRISWDPVTAQKGGFKHFMLKEVHEQPQVIADTLRGRVSLDSFQVGLPELNLDQSVIKDLKRVVLIACGTAWHACLIAKFYIENLAKIPCEVDYASEFRYRSPILTSDTLVVAISQSGETADTLAAIEMAGRVSPTVAICNVLGSSMSRKVQGTIFTHAGPEISVASTKAFTTQITAALLLALHLAQVRKAVTEDESRELIDGLLRLPGAVDEVLKCGELVEATARRYHSVRDFLFVARGVCYPIALEGALKMKEISYIHAEGYPAGELKHGPLALIDESIPVVVVLQRSDVLFEKTVSNLKEVETRGGQIIVVTDAVVNSDLRSVAKVMIEVPHISGALSPIIMTIPLQLLAYYIAVANGTDVDLPRNLAKSVTVE